MQHVLLLFTSITVASSLKILGYNSIFGYSHANYIGKIADVLSEAGHEVVLLTSVIHSRLPNRTSEHARVIFFNQTAATKKYETTFDKDFSGQWMTKTTDVFGMLTTLENLVVALTNQCQALIETPGFLDELRKENFDAGYCEEMDQCSYAIFHLLGIDKYATAHSLPSMDGTFAFSGMPSITSYVPAMFSASSDKMTVFERMNNIASQLFLTYYYNSYVAAFDRKFREMNLGIPPQMDLVAGSSFFFLNTEPLLDFPRPSVAKIIEVGGITASKFAPLNENWSEIMDRRPKTVFISFGTNVLSHEMPVPYKKSILDVIRSFPNVTFIWKYEKPEDRIGEGIQNLVAVRWAPQNDLLHDARMSAFVTHGGAGSIAEGTVAGVPLVVVPVFCDQFRNAHQAERTGAAVFVRKESLEKPDSFGLALRRVLDDESYQKRAKTIAQMLAERPFSMRDRLVKHVEFMAKHGPFPQLDQYGTKLSFIEYYLLDVAAVLIVTALFTLAFVSRLVIIALNRIMLMKTKLE